MSSEESRSDKELKEGAGERQNAGSQPNSHERVERLNSILRAIRNVNQLITKETDRQRLIQGTCENLAENLSYRNAWVALLDDDGESVVATARSGTEGDFEKLRGHLNCGEFPACMRTALDQNGVAVLRDTDALCRDCPMADIRSQRCGFACRLEFEGRIYGVITVYVPRSVADDPEEHELFEELAGDLAFALHKIENERIFYETQAKYREIFEGSRDGFVMVDTDGRITDANRAFCEMLGYTLDELRALEDFMVVTPESWHEWEKEEIWNRRLLQHGESGVYEKEYIRKDGSVFPVELRSYAVRNDQGEIEYLWGTARDIGNRKQKEERIALLGKMLDDAPAAITIHDTKGEFIFTNRHNILLHGYASMEEFLKVNLHELDVPESEILLEKRFKQIAENGEARFEVMHYRKDYSIFPLEITAKSIEWHGQPAVLSIATDISDRKQAESERENLQNQLMHSQRMESVGRLAGGVAHDFNNLLMGIMNYAEISLDEIEDDHPVRNYIEEIRSEAQRSADLVRQLLAFARKQTIAPKVVDINEIVSNMLKMLRRLIGEDIQLSWMPGSSIHSIKIDPGQIDQLLANLCVNARDAIKGVGQITIETRSVTLDESYCASHSEVVPGDYVMLAVSDDGCGIEAETMENIFDPFYTTKDVGEGTGLGLATVYGIVKQNEGSINVYSEPGKGSTFRIYFPRFEGEKDQIKVAAQPEEIAGGAETIMLVEDEDAIRLTTTMALEHFGYEVLPAADPAEALQIDEQDGNTIDLLVTDVVMPGMDGRQLAEKLTARHPEMKVLFMSGYTANVIAHRGILEEGVEFLSKPITRAQLAKKIRSLLDGEKQT